MALTSLTQLLLKQLPRRLKKIKYNDFAWYGWRRRHGDQLRARKAWGGRASEERWGFEHSRGWGNTKVERVLGSSRCWGVKSLNLSSFRISAAQLGVPCEERARGYVEAGGESRLSCTRGRSQELASLSIPTCSEQSCACFRLISCILLKQPPAEPGSRQPRAEGKWQRIRQRSHRCAGC